MLEKLIPLLGMSLEKEEIKALYTAWNAQYPKRITYTANESNIKGKVEKDCIRLYFGRGGNSKYLKPIPTTWAGGFIGMLTMIEFTKKSRGGIPFNVTHAMAANELTAIGVGADALFGAAVAVQSDDRGNRPLSGFWHEQNAGAASDAVAPRAHQQHRRTDDACRGGRRHHRLKKRPVAIHIT